VFVRLPSKPKRFFPWATVSVALLCVAIAWLQTDLESPLRDALLRRFAMIPARYGAATDPQTLFLLGLPALFSALLIHADWVHLIGNLAFLLPFGVYAERALGSGRLLFIFFACGAMANLVAALLAYGSQAPIIGSSGAVSAIAGSYLALFPRDKLGLMIPLGLYVQFVRVPVLALLGSWFLLQLTYTFFGPSFGAVAWWAHVAGFVLGTVSAIAMRPGLRPKPLA
jgi:membrane associated rhomboid family serine protease